jgi:integrase/DNA-binding XRE family transcriptional regulator
MLKGLGDRIRYLREKRGWSQEQLVIQARHVSGNDDVLSRVTLSRIENGHQLPTIATLMAVTAALNTTMDYLCGMTDDPRPRESRGIPEDLEPLVERLERLEPEERKKVIDGFIHMLDIMADLAASEEEWPPDIQESELVALKLRDYDRKRGQVMIRHGKGDKTRVIFVGNATRQAIWRYLAERGDLPDSAPLFATHDGKPLDRYNVYKMLHLIGRRAGVRNVYPHRFRHTFAIAFLRNGGNPLELQEMLGHARLDTVRIYVHLAEIDLERAQKNASPADNWHL